MNIHLNILKKGAKVAHWPDREHNYIKCTIGTKEANYETDLHKTEVVLSEALMLIKSKISKKEFEFLLKSIDEYGQQQYYEGGSNESMSNADASI